MFYSAEQEKRILAQQEIMRSTRANEANLCQYKNVSCVRCCLPHIGGDSYLEDSGLPRTAPTNKSARSDYLPYTDRYLGPGNIVMKFKSWQDPGFGASRYEDSFPDAGQEEMERRFSERRALFLEIYDRQQPAQSLPRYMNAAQKKEGYKYRHRESAGPASMFLGGSVPKMTFRKGELPECQLLGFIDGNRTAGCMAHPSAETSQGYDGRDRVGFFHNTGCCRSAGCGASKEFEFLSPSAMKIFERAVDGMSWYEYSRHATSVLVYYLRGYDHLLQRLDELRLLDSPALDQIAGFTNALYDDWPIRRPGASLTRPPEKYLDCMNILDLLSTEIPLSERILYIALDSGFLRNRFDTQLRQARDCVQKHIEKYPFH